MDERELMAEALAASAAHLRAVRALARPVMHRVKSAAISGAAIPRSDLASAGLLSQEIAAAEARVHRLREAARQRTDTGC